MIHVNPMLEEVAGAILDGTAVNWEAVESGSEPSAGALLAQLRLLSNVRAVARGSAPDGASPEYWGHLRLLERTGRGAHGEVHRAWDTRLDREVALKLLPADPASGNSRTSSVIIEEGRLLARVRHPNVVTIYGAERVGDRTGLWMEFVKGRTLEGLLCEGRTFTAKEVTDLCVQLCGAVAAVHGAGLLHRDIKTQNVMLAEDGRLVLMDFGTGRELAEESKASLAGTPLYLAPEVLSGGRPTVRSDVYAIGVVLYHLLTGSYPVTARRLDDLRRAHASGASRDVRLARPDLPLALSRVIQRALDPDPDRRYPSAQALAADLAPVENARGISRRALAMIAASVMLIAAIGWAGWQLRDRGRLPGFLGTSASAVLPFDEAPVIAVLPFKNLSAQPDSDYFADGLTDEIIRNLAVIDGLQVRSQTSSFYFKNTPRNVRDVGEQLRANLIVDGSVQRDGRRLRVTAQLIQVAGDVTLWSDRFDRPLEDLFSVQDEISRAIVNRLRLTLGRGQRRYQTNVEAYELYLRGRALIERRGTQSAQQAVVLFEQATANDPAFAPAHAGLAFAAALMSNEIVPGALSAPEALARMRPAAVKAVELDPLLSEAHAAMGMTYSRERDWANARRSFSRAIELNPSLTQNVTHYSTTTLMPLGEFEEARRLLARAAEADPLSLAVRRELAHVQLNSGRYDEAITSLKGILAIDPTFTYVDLFLARALALAGRTAEALAIFEGRKEIGWQFWAAHAYVASGQRERVEAMLPLAQHPFREAVLYTALGNKDRAFDALNRAAAADSRPHRVVLLLVYPEMASLRDDPRYRALRTKLNLP